MDFLYNTGISLYKLGVRAASLKNHKAKQLLEEETDPEMKEMAREELAINEELRPKIEEEIKIFSNKQKLKEYSNTKPIRKEILKGCL